MVDVHAHTSFCFSTSPGDSAAQLQALNERSLVLHVEPLCGSHASADIQVHACPELRIMSASLSGVRHGAPPLEQGDELLLAGILDGTSTLAQRGRAVDIGRGQCALLTRADGIFNLCHPQRVKFFGLRLPRNALAATVPRFEDVLLKPLMQRSDGVFSLLTSYLTVVAEQRMLGNPALAGTIVNHAYELVAQLVREACGQRESSVSVERSVRAARLERALRYVRVHLTDQSLSANVIARDQRISTRYLHVLFEQLGTTLSQHVLSSRLERAYAVLTDPRHAERSISNIAFDSGFADLSYFNRTFRRHFGVTPSEVRAAHNEHAPERR